MAGRRPEERDGPSPRIGTHMRRITGATALGLTLLLLTSCGGGAPPPSEQPAPTKTAPAAPPPAPPAAPPTEPAPSTQPAQPTLAFVPEKASGTSRLAIDISRPWALAGLELHVSFDADRFVAGAPEITDQLQGFLCADNPGLRGRFLYICAKVPGREVSGRLAVVPIHYQGAAFGVGDLKIDKVGLVDDESVEAPEGVELVYSIID